MSNKKEVVAALESWAKAWVTKERCFASSHLAFSYKYSPQWVATWDRCWSQYDQCVSGQLSTGASRFPWQDEVERYRAEAEDGRRRDFRPLNDKPKLRQYLPLSIYLEYYLQHSSLDRRLSWSTALDTWQRFRNLAHNDTSFREGLSNSQKSSLQILTHWWTTSEQSLRPLVAKTQSFMEKMRDEPYLENPTQNSNLLELSSEIGTDISFHHAACFELFCLEFHPMAWEPFVGYFLRNLQDARQRGVGHFTCYLFAHAVNDNPEVALASYPLPIRNDQVWYENLEFQETPYYLWDTAAQKTVLVEDLIRNSVEQPPRCPDYVCISHTWGRWRKPTEAQVTGVKWPVPENKRYDVRKLPDMLSHSGLECRYVWFDLFCIPQSGDDKRKDIEIGNQAAIFRKSCRCIAWVNQCDSWDGVDKALKWIGLRYLKSTHRSPPSWLDEEMTHLRSLGLDTVELLQEDEIEKVYSAVGWFTSLWTLQEAVLCPDMEIYSKDWIRLARPATLTTLMSFLEDAPYLCWDSEPANDLSFADSEDYETKVEGSSSETRNFLDRFPYGPASLIGLAHNSQISRVLQTLSPMFVFAELNFRTYTDVCAPAIMSAIGVTDWHAAESATGRVKTREPLVLGQFPLAFLQEAARKIGSPFFESHPRPDKMSIVNGTSRIGPSGLTGQGSMLPVNSASMKFTRINHFEDFHEERYDHPSVAEWVLKEDGSVYMRTAAIAACTPCEGPDDVGNTQTLEHSSHADVMSTLSLQCLSRGVPSGIDEALENTLSVAQARIPGIDENGTPSFEYLEDIHFLSVEDEDCDGTYGLTDALSAISGGSALFAVVTCSDGNAQQGIILAQVDQEEDFGSKRLVKVGCYCIDNLPSHKSKLPKSRRVDWLVL